MKHLVTALFMVSTLAMAKAKSVLVTTPNADGFACEFRPEQSPPVVENDLIKFKVKVKGGSGPYRWKLPLYKANNGDNDVSLARIGIVSLSDDRTFIIDLNVQDLQKVMKKELSLQLESRERYQATCSTAAEPVRSLASAQPPKELVIEAGLVPR